MPNICSCPSRCWWALPALLSLRRKGPSSPSTTQGIAPAPRNLAPRFWCPGPKAGPSPTPLTPLTPLTWPFSGHFKLGTSKCSIAALKKTQWHMPQELSQQTNQAGTSLVGYPCLRANPSQENKENKITMPFEKRWSWISWVSHWNISKPSKDIETCWNHVETKSPPSMLLAFETLGLVACSPEQRRIRKKTSGWYEYDTEYVYFNKWVSFKHL